MRILTALSALAVCALAGTAQAGAWLQPKHEGLFVAQATYFSNTEFYDRSGRTRPQAKYTKYELQPYLEYGLADNLTMGATAYLQRADQSNRDNYGIADPEFFLRTALWKGERQIVSIQPLVKLRSEFEHNTTPRGGSSSTDAELSLLYGRNMDIFSPRDYLDVRVGYRFRGNKLNDQIRADAALGLNVSENWTLVPAMRLIDATKIPSGIAFSENGDQDYTLLKAEIGASYRLSQKQAVSITVFDHIDGKQTGNGSGLSLGFMQRF